MTPSEQPSWLPDANDERNIAKLWWLVGIVLAAGLVAFLIRGANRPADPVLRDTASSASRTPLPGFGEVAVTIEDPAGGEPLDRCLLLAATEAQHQRGLMEVTDPTLGGYDGMLFEFADDVQAGFYMRNTPMPLSIAFVDSGGRLVTALDMPPCGDVANCPTYSAAGPYRYAIEVPQGHLADLGITQTSVFSTESGLCR